MTTPWTISPIWKGQTVAILACGPSMSQEVADSLRLNKCIAVNHAYKLAPWADMLVALDLNMPLWHGARNFAGMRVCGVPTENIDALYPGPMHERVCMGPLHNVEIHNSGLAAIKIAKLMGASKIILAGFNPEVAGHFEGYPEGGRKLQHAAVATGLRAVIKDLRATGVEVEIYSAITKQENKLEMSQEKKKLGKRLTNSMRAALQAKVGNV